MWLGCAAALLPLPAAAEQQAGVFDIAPLESVATDLTPDVPSYEFLSQQIRNQEAGDALTTLNSVVSEIEQTHHRYHDSLVEPLMLSGDAQMQLGEVDAALDSFSRARHIARVSHGLFDRRQMPLVYREADAFRALGDLQAAAKREEYAYEVARKDYGEYDIGLLPAIERLATFYLESRNPLPARVLYNRALRILEFNKQDSQLHAVSVLRGIARSHRMERFPPIFIAQPNDPRLAGPQPGLTNADLDRQHLGINTFHSGERALQRVIEIRQQHEQPTQQLDAMLELADWHQMFGRLEDAGTLYGHIYQTMLEAELDADAFFAKPVMIYFPRPENPRPPPAHKRNEASEGVVELGFAVSQSGRVRNLKTLRSEPPRLMDFRVRRSMRVAIFRPSLHAGLPAAAEDQNFAYTYPYFPSSSPTTPAPAGTASSKDDATNRTVATDAE